MEFQITQGAGLTGKEAVRKKSPVRERSGIAGVGNVGMDSNWTGDKLAQANLYGFGRLSWDNSLSWEIIAGEWVRQTFYLGAEKEAKIAEILNTSCETYED